MLKYKIKNKDKQTITEEGIPRNIARFGSSLFLKGELSGEEDLVIEGRFKGKINLGDHNILVGQGGDVNADIHVKNITINGSVSGNIYAAGKVFISKEGKMKGDINAPIISIMDGAQFKGGIKMEQEGEQVSLPEEETGTPAPKEEGEKVEKEEEEKEATEEKEEVESPEKEGEPGDEPPSNLMDS